MGWTRGWNARGLALAAGAMAGLAHPPFGILPGLLGYALLLALIDAPSPHPLRSALLRGWLAGVGYFAVGMWWITEPFMVDAKEQGWMAPFALVLMAGGLALFWGAAALLHRALKARGAASVLVFAGCLAGFEWLRGHVFTGLPWDLPGETWRAGSWPSQAAALVGAYGLTWITVAIAASPSILVQADATWRAKIVALSSAAVALAGLYGYGLARLDAVVKPQPGAPIIRIVQANIDQKEKWRPENLSLILDTYTNLSRRKAAVQPSIVIWPEGALPAVIDEMIAPGSPYASRLRDAVAPGQTLLMGANRAETGPTGTRYFNSLVAFHREAGALRVTGVYDKHHLVPFGEYMPAADFATKIGFRSLVHMPDDFTAGPPAQPIAPWGVPAVQVLICSEALFPGVTRLGGARAGLRPAWILNISNDAWFGAGSGPLQHLNIASYRAIEEGLPIIRATPTGVSAVIDAYGRISSGAKLNPGDLGVIDASLPPALERTSFSRLGDLLFGIMLLLSGTTALADRYRRS